ncbi:MAG TPA: hypothetical protein VIT43_12290 [Candidatus Dormibacteraeota bacterium]
MRVCKRCGCALPIGQKTCDICDRTSGGASYQPVAQWTPPPASVERPISIETPTSIPSEAAIPLTSVPIMQLAGRPRDPKEVGKWQKSHRWAWRYLATLGVLYIGLGLTTALGYLPDYTSLFGWTAVVVGGSFCWFAFTVRRGSLLGISMAMVVYAAYTVAFLNAGSFVFFRFFILLSLGRAWLSIYALSQHQKTQAAPSANQSAAA